MSDLRDHIRSDHKTYTDKEMLKRAQDLRMEMSGRRTVLEFSSEPLNGELPDALILTTGTTPSLDHKQPWTFSVATSSEIKKKNRKAAEIEEYKNYHGRMADGWMNDIKNLGADHNKDFLDEASALILVFKRLFEEIKRGLKNNNYYFNEFVAIASGLLRAASQRVEGFEVTHASRPTNFSARVLGRQSNERDFLFIPVGHPKEGTKLPGLKRKIPEDIRDNYR